MQTVYQDVRRLVALAYPGQVGELIEIVARDAFLDALGDQSMRVRILEKEPANLDAALKIACRLEALGCSASDHSFDESGNRKDRYARAVSGTVEDDRVDRLKQELATCRDELSAVKRESDQLRQQVNRGVPLEENRQARGQWNQVRQNPEPHQFYQAPRGGPPNSDRARQLSRDVCHKCGNDVYSSFKRRSNRMVNKADNDGWWHCKYPDSWRRRDPYTCHTFFTQESVLPQRLRNPLKVLGEECRQCTKPGKSSQVRVIQTRAQTRLQENTVRETEEDEVPVGADVSGDRPWSTLRRDRPRRGENRVVSEPASSQTEWTAGYLRDQQLKDVDLAQLRQWVIVEGVRPHWDVVRAASPSLKAYWQQWNSIVCINDVLYRRLEASEGRELSYQLILPQALRPTLCKMVHEGAAGHLGVFKTREHVVRRAYWFNWRRDVEMFCKTCEVCQSYCKGGPKKQGKLKPMVMGAPTERWSIDLTGPHVKSVRGFVYILTAVCAFSKYVVMVPLRDKSAVTVAKAIFEQVFLRYGAGEILTDGGGEFRNEIVTELCRLFGVYKSQTTAYQPSTNGGCERFHLTLNSMLAKVVSENQRDWCERLAHVALCYNASVHESTGYTPFMLMHGREVRWGVDLLLDSPRDEPRSVNDFAAMLIERLETAQQLVRDNLQTTAQRMRCWYDRKVHLKVFQEGDEVYVLNLRRYANRSPKWMRKYSDVGIITEKINDVTYKVASKAWRSGLSRIVHVNKLKLKSRANRGVDENIRS